MNQLSSLSVIHGKAYKSSFLRPLFMSHPIKQEIYDYIFYSTGLQSFEAYLAR